MTPGSFDPITARDIIGDEPARAIETKARMDADAKTFACPGVDGSTYWANVENEMRAVLYREQYAKRLARNARKSVIDAIRVTK